jgi:methylenetetrahydrofolate dehydrogenase (NADP+)/methenyltetrahydrofolate cyclohydrolase
MTAKLLDGKKVADTILQTLQQHVHSLEMAHSPVPGLAVVLIGNDPASKLYVQRKRQACKAIGFQSFEYDLPTSTTQADLLALIHELNDNPAIHGILIQLPLPAHINDQAILEAILPHKDVDGFHPFNIGRLAQGRPSLSPCTPAGIIKLLAHYQIALEGKHAIVVGASNIVGRPMALEFLLANCTVTICHSHTQDLAQHVQQADILVTAIGRTGVIASDWLKPGVIAIDVGMNYNAEGKLCGDLDFASAQTTATWITPVPGGVGPMTVAMLMQNTYDCFLKTRN